jgi:hypothetical protein
MLQENWGFYGLHCLACGSSGLTPETMNLYIFLSTSWALAQPKASAYTGQHKQKTNSEILILQVGFEPTIPVLERPKH